MAAVARGLLALLVASVTFVLLIDRLQPVDERGDHSVRLVIGVVAGIAMAQIGVAMVRRRAEIWQPVTPWWRRPRSTETRHEPPAIGELEALIIGAANGGPRARDRLDRRLKAVGCDTLAEQLTEVDPTPDQVTAAIDQILANRSRPSQGSHDR